MKNISLLLFVILSGCSFGFGGGTARQYYVLEELGDAKQPNYQSCGLRLLVRDTEGSGFIDSHRIVFRESDFTRGYYQFASWAEPPSKAVTNMLLNRLNQSGLFSAVGRQANAISADVQLNTTIADFFHDVREHPGTVHVAMAAELVSLSDRSVISRREFSKVVKVKSYDAAGAVAGFNVAVDQILAELLSWLNEAIAKAPPAN